MQKYFELIKKGVPLHCQRITTKPKRPIDFEA